MLTVGTDQAYDDRVIGVQGLGAVELAVAVGAGIGEVAALAAGEVAGRDAPLVGRLAGVGGGQGDGLRPAGVPAPRRSAGTTRSGVVSAVTADEDHGRRRGAADHQQPDDHRGHDQQSDVAPWFHRGRCWSRGRGSRAQHGLVLIDARWRQDARTTVRARLAQHRRAGAAARTR